MNTNLKGATYERAVRKLLLLGAYTYCVRSTCSRSPADLIAWKPLGRLAFVQCKAGTVSCAAAMRLAKELVSQAPIDTLCLAVHKTAKKEFCWHQGSD